MSATRREEIKSTRTLYYCAWQGNAHRASDSEHMAAVSTTDTHWHAHVGGSPIGWQSAFGRRVPGLGIGRSFQTPPPPTRSKIRCTPITQPVIISRWGRECAERVAGWVGEEFGERRASIEHLPGFYLAGSGLHCCLLLLMVSLLRGKKEWCARS